MLTSAVFSLFALSNAAYVTQTEWATFYVTVGNDGVVISDSQSTSPTASIETTIISEITPTVESSNSVSSTSVQSFSIVTPSTSLSWQIPSRVTTTTSLTWQTPSRVTTSPETPATTSTSSSSSASTSTSEAQPTLAGFQADIVNYHNKVRAEHHVGSVTWSDTLAGYAQQYLDNSNCVFAHSGGPYGENIAIGYPSTDAALDAWYNEEDQYNYAAGQFGENTGHFTQMVWKGSTEVGCATIQCSGGTFLACEYSPAGNVIGRFTDNVFPK